MQSAISVCPTVAVPISTFYKDVLETSPPAPPYPSTAQHHHPFLQTPLPSDTPLCHSGPCIIIIDAVPGFNRRPEEYFFFRTCIAFKGLVHHPHPSSGHPALLREQPGQSFQPPEDGALLLGNNAVSSSHSSSLAQCHTKRFVSVSTFLEGHSE